MQRQISESDWKLLRRLQPLALERLCQGILSEVVQLASGATRGSHARYLEVFKLIRERDEEVGKAFDELKRSNAFVKLARMRSLGLVTDEELASFSAETQDVIALFLET